MVDQWLQPIPDKMLEDRQTAEWFRDATLFFDDLTRENGVIETGETTTEVVVTHSEKLDYMTITASINLDTVKADTAANKTAISEIQTSSPDYTISNDGTVRTLNADAALITAGATYSQADMQTLIDAFGVLSDFVATMNRDLQDKDIFG